MSDGYIKWYRKAEDNPAFRVTTFDELHAWLWLVERANFKRVTIRFNNGRKTLQRGQMWTSIRQLAKTWNWGKEHVADYLDNLESNGMIKRVSDTSGTLLTIENYDKYQSWADTSKDDAEDTSRYNTKAQDNKKEGGHGQHRSDDRASAPFNDPRYYDIDPGEPEPW